MKIIYNRIIPFGKHFLAINLFGILFAKGRCSREVVNHEKIHTAQMKEMAFIFFYIWYVAEWFVRLAQYGFSTEAYRNISFEREAYARQRDGGYLQRRPRFAWTAFLRRRDTLHASGRRKN